MKNFFLRSTFGEDGGLFILFSFLTLYFNAAGYIIYCLGSELVESDLIFQEAYWRYLLGKRDEFISWIPIGFIIFDNRYYLQNKHYIALVHYKTWSFCKTLEHKFSIL